jgi:hypothetical protein
VPEIEYDRIYGYHVGGISITFGRARQDEKHGPRFYGAALSEEQLKRGLETGFGATESEAVADMFRHIRPIHF